MYNIDKLRVILTNVEYKTVNEDGQCFPPSNDVYKRISIAMNGNPSSKHVYTIVKNNRNGLYNEVLNAFNIKNSSLEATGDCSFDPNESTTICKKKFELSLTYNQWKNIEPVEITYDDGRNYIKFQQEWTDLFAESIWMQHRIPCPWTFKTVKK